MEKYQTVGPRILASIIDSLVMMPFSIIGTFAAGLGSVHPVFAVIGANLPGILSVVYITFAHAYYGQTVGKKVMKIKVLDDSEKPLIFGQAVLRSLPQIATVFFVLTFSISSNTSASKFNLGLLDDERSINSSLIMLFWIVYMIFQLLDIALFLINEKHRSLHDFIAGTVVVKTNV